MFDIVVCVFWNKGYADIMAVYKTFTSWYITHNMKKLAWITNADTEISFVWSQTLAEVCLLV